MRGLELLNHLKEDFIGIDTQYRLVNGRLARRHYLDSAASTLAMRSAHQVSQEFLRHYANSHSQLHFAARISTEAYREAHEEVLRFTGTDPGAYTCFFSGSGSTAGLNRLARMLCEHRPERDSVLVSGMEHHSNDLPHRKYARQVIRVPLIGEAPALGQIDLEALERLLDIHSVNYVAVTAASNVTGIINPIHEVAALAHAYGAWIIVDGSQLVAHATVQMVDPARAERNIDFLVFSGHKVYAPGSPGVVVGKRALLRDLHLDDVGGGMVDTVSVDSYEVTRHVPDRLEPGTPNIVGAVFLGSALEILQRIGMDYVHQEEGKLLRRALDALLSVPGVRLYGSIDVPRTGVISFNLEGLDHGLVAAALNDYHNVAVRNECFCAHPYVREMLLPELWQVDLDLDQRNALDLVKHRRGMVRASFGLYTKEDDIFALVDGIKDLLARREHYSALYKVDTCGNHRHIGKTEGEETLFNSSELIESLIGNRYKLGLNNPIHKPVL
jgi:cysteine desulfurase / selenocysteine lyase